MESLRVHRVLNGRYRLDALLGEGGMGKVYRAFDLTIEREVAVKVMERDAQATPEDAACFLREVRATAVVQNPHCVTLFDVGEEGGHPYLVMNLIAGESLAALLVREKALPAARAVSIAAQVCEALAAAHAAGIIHRDIKPQNIMVAQKDGDDFVTVLDFGIAKHVDQKTKITGDGMMIGTIEYMAPEQIAGEAVDGRTDQYALAVTLVRAISGQPLFPGTGVASLIHHQLLTVPTLLHERVPSAPRALDGVLRRALEKKAGARFPDITVFGSALRAAVEPGARAADVADLPASTVSDPRPRGGSTQDVELALDGQVAHLELDVAPGQAPRALAAGHIAANIPLVLPVAEGPPLAVVPHAELRHWTSPRVWKRVLAYSALALVLGNGCIRGFSATSSIILGAVVVLAGIALVINARLSKDAS